MSTPRKRKAADPTPAAIADVGMAKQTKRGRSSAWQCFLDYEQKEKGDNLLEELDEIDDDGAKGELVMKTLIGFAEYLRDSPIQQKTNKDKSLGDDSMKQYLGSVKEHIKEMFPSLPVWKNHDDGGWYSQLRSEVGKGKRREILRGDYDFKDPSSRGLPIRCAESELRVSERLFAGLKGVDLESVCKSMMASGGSNHFRERAKLVITALAVGRGGEVAFMKYNEMWWDDLFGVAEAIWTRLKTVMQQSIYFQSDPNGYVCDFLHSLGCYFAVEDGLFRLANMPRQMARRVFPDLQNISTDNVASRMTTLIRAHSDPVLKQRNQSRSIRVGMNTVLAAHEQVSPEEQRNAGGFKSGFNTDLYTRMNPKLGMTAANALAGHKNARKMAYPPSLDCLVSFVDADSMNELMGKLFLNSVPQFKLGGSLRPLLHAITAKLIMEHPKMRSDFGRENTMVQKLVDSMVKAKLAVDAGTASKKLDQWSLAIRADYDTKNKLIPSATDATLLETVQQQSVLINELVLSNGRIQQKLESVTSELVSMREMSESQNQSLVSALTTSLVGALSTVWQGRIQTMTTETQPVNRPADREQVDMAELQETGEAVTAEQQDSDDPMAPSPPSSPAQIQRHRMPAQASQNESVPDVVAAFIKSIQTMMQDAELAGKKDSLKELAWSKQRGTSVKGMTIKEILVALVEENRLQNEQKLYDVQPSGLDTKNHGHYWASMELVETVMTAEQRKLLGLIKKQEREKVNDFDDVLKIAAYNIEAVAFNEMQRLDGKTASTLRATLSGLGNRYTAYCTKNEIPRKKGQQKNAAPPPANNRSMMEFVTGGAKRIVAALSPRRRTTQQNQE